MSAHTPGPLIVERVTPSHFLVKTSPEAISAVAVVWTEADAHLFAAAPDLFAELEMAQAEIASYRAALLMLQPPLEMERTAQRGHDARRAAVIAKARGGR